jgi:anthranilate synthase component 2
MIFQIDNYDSFTFNLFHYLDGLGARVVIHRNDKIAASDVVAADPDTTFSRLLKTGTRRAAAAQC